MPDDYNSNGKYNNEVSTRKEDRKKKIHRVNYTSLQDTKQILSYCDHLRLGCHDKHLTQAYVWHFI